MTNETTQKGRTILAILAVVIGLFLIFVAPFISQNALSTPLHRLIEVNQIQDPDGVWDTPVGILTATFNVWIALFVFGGAILIMIAKDIYAGKEWARPLAITMMAIPSMGGMTMTIPWLVLVVTDALGNPNPEAGMPPAMPIMVVGLIGYFSMLLIEKASAMTKVAQTVVFLFHGVVGGMVFMNAQHGVRHFLTKGPFFNPTDSNPELFLGGFVMYAATAVFFVAIYFMAERKELGWYAAMTVGIVTFAAAFLAFVDRYNVPSGQEWLRGAMLSAVYLIIMALPWFKKRIYGQE
ncbi:MAG: hypothetical protein ISS57_05275 [Anaerolineales bacterium]|nr:hypothetical protein [Anaerolineales bacterium]